MHGTERSRYACHVFVAPNAWKQGVRFEVSTIMYMRVRWFRRWTGAFASLEIDMQPWHRVSVNSVISRVHDAESMIQKCGTFVFLCMDCYALRASPPQSVSGTHVSVRLDAGRVGRAFSFIGLLPWWLLNNNTIFLPNPDRPLLVSSDRLSQSRPSNKSTE